MDATFLPHALLVLNPRWDFDRETGIPERRVCCTALAGVGAAGSATADHVRPGQCARIIYDVQSYTSCSETTYGPILRAGSEGTIFETCSESNQVQFVESGIDGEMGYISDSYIERC